MAIQYVYSTEKKINDVIFMQKRKQKKWVISFNKQQFIVY